MLVNTGRIYQKTIYKKPKFARVEPRTSTRMNIFNFYFHRLNLFICPTVGHEFYFSQNKRDHERGFAIASMLTKCGLAGFANV